MKQTGCSSDGSSAIHISTLESTAAAEPLVFIDTPSTETPTSALPTRRQVSSIPRSIGGGDTAAPHPHPSKDTTAATTEDPQKTSYWVYPSQQQFYDAMKRKNYDPTEEDMAVLVPLHNIVNEMAWRKVLQWEAKYQEYVRW